ncbi:uncharacterized protein MONOS_14188 [Monocercomonoides exilis]|uniref:uncharacterized protein n=1 Tax=Monocercomonoides exilis TaxID=2049356 RepID=UPI00355A179D|nr:hypothetical protein MONOS_14188 [Monocercomonoides exilis]|eukprot:MONOS_14188.1-p1 / transcript=MONOS_14188.1 / gene=MONOS_14188 / organism=Monocercomonoides_exilis_PA203 / gene_product=unspecified product / transcript_product=unspecified product / location=Mono_scaffold00952:13788-14021(-) / protein_length=78 / sequence_SO=supercontig / SO=protein_coding / is_pseudo=false
MTLPPSRHPKDQSQVLMMADHLLLPSSLSFSASGMAKNISALLQFKKVEEGEEGKEEKEEEEDEEDEEDEEEEEEEE